MTQMMKALVKARPEVGLVMEERPVPTPGPNDVLVKIRKTAICGTDVHIWNWDEFAQSMVPVPNIVGHEFCGEIVELGSAVTDLKIGQRVSAEGHIVCGTCRNCRAGRGQLCRNSKGIGVTTTGIFAEYASIPASNIIPVPDDIPDEIAAIFDPYGNAVHTALSFDLVGEDVLVTGAGPIGIMGAMVAKRAGARKVVITDINPQRLELCRRVGIDYVVNAAEQDLGDVMQSIGMTEGFDVGLEMSGAPIAFNDMIDKMNNGGKIALLGIAPSGFGIEWNKVLFKMLTIKGISGREMYETWYKMIALVQGGLDLTPIITHRIKVDDFVEGFETMREGNCGKVVMDWS